MTSSTQLTVAEAFSEAVLHDRHVILGREMHSFCMDHWLILDALGSPLIHGGEVRIIDLQYAIIACSTGNTIDFYDATLRPTFGWALWLRVTRHFLRKPILRAFNAYVDDYLLRISRYRLGEDDEAKCPTLFLAAAPLVEAGHDPAKIRRMPIGEMMAWGMAIAEAKGDPLRSVKSAAEIAADRKIAEEEAAS